ncbi:hypothetical protein ENBRE01_2635 [Enteropsectra breve]|nr:hypothetical protein ENBRE01_2635 [Enteropsectra breve]
MSIRTDSFFELFNISLVDVYLIVFGWVTDKQNCSLQRDFHVKKNTIKKIYKILRELVSGYFVSMNVALGGPGIICQIDESKMNHKTKYNVGKGQKISRCLELLIHHLFQAKLLCKLLRKETQELHSQLFRQNIFQEL